MASPGNSTRDGRSSVSTAAGHRLHGNKGNCARHNRSPNGDAVGRLPICRSLLAKDIAWIAAGNPSVLAIDLLLSEPSSEDAELASVLADLRGVVLAADEKWILPVPALRQDATVAHVHAAPDPDGVVRSVLLASVGEGTRGRCHSGDSCKHSSHDSRPVHSCWCARRKPCLFTRPIQRLRRRYAVPLPHPGPLGSRDDGYFTDCLTPCYGIGSGFAGLITTMCSTRNKT